MTTKVNYSVLGYLQTAQAGNLVLETNSNGYGTLYFGASGNNQQVSVDGSNNLVITGLNLKVGSSGSGSITAGTIGGTTISASTEFSGSGAGLTSIPGGEIIFGSIPNSSLAHSTISGIALGNNLATLTFGTHLTGTSYNGSTGVTIATDATSGSTYQSGTLVAYDGNGDVWGRYFQGTATSANYADLAEKYLADSEYAPGTVLIFGGDKEVTLSTEANDRRVAGVVSTNPAHMMNAGLKGGVYVALTGRVPCRVVGLIYKGDLIVTSGIPGVAMANNDPKMGTVIGKALENYQSTEVGVIEVVVGRV